jgi:hypothetical protein
MTKDAAAPPDTRDGRYIAVRGRLWRKSNPALGEEARQSPSGLLACRNRAVSMQMPPDKDFD